MDASQALPILQFERVHKRYGRKTVLDGVDFAVRPREFVTVVGPSGCGKSTALRLIIGQERATEGEIRMNDEPIGHACPDRGVVYQHYSLYPHLSAVQNVIFSHRLAASPLAWAKRKRAAIDEGMAYLEKVGLADHADKYPSQLSGGQRQRVAIAQALITRPKILCLDEPFSALDPGTREDLQLFLLELWEETGMTLFFVTHDLEEAVYLGTRLIALSQYYSDDRGPAATRGAKIVVDRRFGPDGYALSPNVKTTPEFRQAIKDIRVQAFDPDYRQHVSKFDLSHPDSRIFDSDGPSVAGD